MKTKFSENDIANYFDFLDDLRASGKTNMFGAPPYLKKAFRKLDASEAQRAVSLWMHPFKRDAPMSDRVQAALKELEARP